MLQVQLAISILTALAVIFAASRISGWMNADGIAFYLQVYAVGIPVTGMIKIHKAILIGRGHFKLKAWLDGGYWVLRLALVILLFLARPSVTAVLVANIISVAVVLFAARIFVKPAIFSVPAGTQIAKLWLYTWSLYFFTLCTHLGQAMDLILVKAGLPPENAGFFAAAKNLTIVPGLVTLGMVPVLLSKLSGLLAEGCGSQARYLLERSIRVVVCLLPFAGMSAGAAGEVVQLIYGAHFIPATSLLAVLILGAVGLTLTQVNAAGLIAVGKTRLPLSIMGPLVPLTAIAYVQCIQRFGTVGAAMVTTVASVLTAALTALAVRRAWRVQPRIALWVKSGGLTVLAFVAARMWATPGGGMLPVKLMVISIGIGAALWIMGELSFLNETDGGWSTKQKEKR